MAPAYELTYFNSRRTAEPIRFLFKYGKIDFEDIRIDRSKEWPKLKETTPFGQLPLLEHDGKLANQSVSICRYVAKLVKLTGNDEWEDLEIDAVVDTICDLRQAAKEVFVEKDGRRKKNFEERVLPYYLERLDALAGKSKGFLALERLTWADIYFTGIYSSIEWFIGHEILDSYPNLKNLTVEVSSLSEIRKWMEERPETDS